MSEAPRSNRPTPRTTAAVEAELRRQIRADMAQAREGCRRRARGRAWPRSSRGLSAPPWAGTRVAGAHPQRHREQSDVAPVAGAARRAHPPDGFNEDREGRSAFDDRRGPRPPQGPWGVPRIARPRDFGDRNAPRRPPREDDRERGFPAAPRAARRRPRARLSAAPRTAAAAVQPARRQPAAKPPPRWRASARAVPASQPLARRRGDHARVSTAATPSTTMPRASSAWTPRRRTSDWGRRGGTVRPRHSLKAASSSMAATSAILASTSSP